MTDTEYANARDAQRAAYDEAGYKHYDCSCDTGADRAAYQRYRGGATTDITADYFFNFPALVSGAKGAFSLGSSGLRGLLGLFRSEAPLTIGSGLEMGQIANVMEKAASAVGRGEITVSSEKVAQEAAEQFLGEGKQPLIQTYGNRAGQQIGWKSADGSKIVRIDTNAAQPHYNFENLQTHSNLHVYF